MYCLQIQNFLKIFCLQRPISLDLFFYREQACDFVTYFLYTDRNIWRNHAPGSPSDADNVGWCINTPVWFSVWRSARKRSVYKPAQSAVRLSNVFGLGPASRAEGTGRRPQVPKRFDNGQQGLWPLISFRPPLAPYFKRRKATKSGCSVNSSPHPQRTGESVGSGYTRRDEP